jgi:hypothetical protein
MWLESGFWVRGAFDKNIEESRCELDEKYFDGWQQSRKMRA